MAVSPIIYQLAGAALDGARVLLTEGADRPIDLGV
jgi:hypothetical protein